MAGTNDSTGWTEEIVGPDGTSYVIDISASVIGVRLEQAEGPAGRVGRWLESHRPPAWQVTVASSKRIKDGWSGRARSESEAQATVARVRAAIAEGWDPYSKRPMPE